MILMDYFLEFNFVKFLVNFCDRFYYLKKVILVNLLNCVNVNCCKNEEIWLIVELYFKSNFLFFIE